MQIYRPNNMTQAAFEQVERRAIQQVVLSHYRIGFQARSVII